LLQQSQQNRNGQLMQSDFPNNVGGTNLADSVFKIQDTQAAGGYNFDYILTGGIRKSLKPSKINSVADTALRSLGFGLYAPASGASKSVIRAADRKLQLFDTGAPSFTALTDDTASAGSNPFAPNTTQPVVFSMFNNGSSNILWAAGGGATLPVGAYSTAKYTTNGVVAPTGSLGTPTVNSHAGGSWSAAGTYYYAVVYRKKSTQALSNAALDVSVTTVNTDDTVTISLTGLTGLDQTLIDQIWIYRSARSGVTSFTTGNLIAQLASSATSFTDKGDIGNPDILTSQNIPRSGNIVLDNSTLPSGPYNVMTMFKRRLVTCQNSTVYLSDLNKSESWPATNVITIPSAGNITAAAVISFTSPQAQSLDEILVLYKEREMWVITGTSYTDWALKFIDQVGCPAQDLVVLANGFLSWIDFRGIYLWDGTSKPIYCSRLLEPLFNRDGDLDKTQLAFGQGEFFRRENQIIWYLSSKTFGTQKFEIRMDLRLTLPQIEQQLTGRNLDAVLTQGVNVNPVYAGLSYIPTGGSQEMLVLGDASGYCYFASSAYSDGGSAYNFRYLTAPLSMGDPNTKKNFVSVIAWVQDVGNWNLSLDYWTDYRTGDSYKTTQAVPLTTENQQTAALWDIAVYGNSANPTLPAAYWDAYTPNVVPVVFNLQAGNNNTTQGSAIQLQFRNDNANQPVTIHGFSVLWSPMGGLMAS
jgi:hypothetical protein